MTPTLPQTIALLQLSRGKQPLISTMTRRVLLHQRWITEQPYGITDLGRRAMSTSPHLTLAHREICGPIDGPARTETAGPSEGPAAQRRDSTSDDLTPERCADLQAFGRGEQPELHPARRRWLVSHGYLVPSAPPRAPRLTTGRRRIAPRPHELTAKGRETVATVGHVEQSPHDGRPAHPWTGTGYRSDSVKRSVRK